MTSSSRSRPAMQGEPILSIPVSALVMTLISRPPPIFVYANSSRSRGGCRFPTRRRRRTTGGSTTCCERPRKRSWHARRPKAWSIQPPLSRTLKDDLEPHPRGDGLDPNGTERDVSAPIQDRTRTVAARFSSDLPSELRSEGIEAPGVEPPPFLPRNPRFSSHPAQNLAHSPSATPNSPPSSPPDPASPMRSRPLFWRWCVALGDRLSVWDHH